MRTEERFNELRDEKEHERPEEVVEVVPRFVGSKKVYECAKCRGRCFSTRGFLKQHYRRRHPEVVEAIQSEEVWRVQSDPFAQSGNATLSKQTEELKAMQGRLDDLIDKTALTMKIKERSDELALKEREVLGLKETINDLRNKYLSLQNQVFSLEEIQRTDALRIARMNDQIQDYERLLKERSLREEKMPAIEKDIEERKGGKEEERKRGRMILEDVGRVDIPARKRRRVKGVDTQTDEFDLAFYQFNISVEKKKKNEVQSEYLRVGEPKLEESKEESKYEPIYEKPEMEEKPKMPTIKPPLEDKPIKHFRKSEKLVEENKSVSLSTLRRLARDKEFRGEKSFHEKSLYVLKSDCSYLHEKPETDMSKLKEKLLQEVNSFRVTNEIKIGREGLSKIEALDVDEDITNRAEELMKEIEEQSD